MALRSAGLEGDRAALGRWVLGAVLVAGGLLAAWEDRRPEEGPVLAHEGPDSKEERRRGWRGRALEGIRPLTAEGRVLLGERVDPNRAEEDLLMAVPGMGGKVARAIVESRRREGRFRSLEDLERVPGLGPATLERIRPYLEIR